ncbi:hypothetical protein ACFL6W_08945 [Thermodesulfobacteriota bacterium]
MERYSRDEVVLVAYHLHIPYPDPMTNPSTLARAEACGVRGTPSYAIDGAMTSGGGGREKADHYYNKLNSMIEARLVEPARARIQLDTSCKDGIVNTKVTVDNVTGESSELRLQIALVEEELSYSGQSVLRFHPMVVRSLGGEGNRGFVIDPSKKTITEHSFNLKEITEGLETHLDETEKERKMKLTQKKHEIDREKLSVVAFIRDTEKSVVLQSAFSRVNIEK